MKNIKLEIKTFGGSILFSYESKDNTIKKTLLEAVKRGAYLRGAYLRGADLRGADLTGAYLRGAYLRGAYLRGAYLTGADLTGADLRGADLRGAYLRGADGDRIGVKKAIFISGLYKYVCIPFIGEDETEWLVLGCYTRTLKEWEKDFWNNDSEFPNNGDEDSELRLLAFETAKKWFKLKKK